MLVAPRTGGQGRGGNASIAATSGSITAFDAIVVDASGGGGLGTNVSGDGTGGIARLTASGSGQISAPATIVRATGSGGSRFQGQAAADTAVGGSGTGGQALLSVQSVPQGLVTSFVSVSADGRGGHANGSASGVIGRGGNATGGTAQAQFTGARESIANVEVRADAFGGSAEIGGDAQGGGATVTVGNSAALTSTAVDVRAVGEGGSGQTGGNGTGGTAALDIISQLASLSTSTIEIRTDGIGGGVRLASSTAPSTIVGGSGFGGTSQFSNSGTLGTNVLTMSASGIGSNGISGNNGPLVSRGGDGVGGRIAYTTDRGFALIGDLVGTADGTGGAAIDQNGTDGNASGGEIEFISAGIGETALSANMNFSARAIGTAGAGTGGTLQGGDIALLVSGFGSSLSVEGALTLNASADAALSQAQLTSSGTARGGTVTVRTDFAGTVSANNFDFNANASSFAARAIAGDAFGGTVLVEAAANSLLQTIGGNNASFISATGEAGSGATGGTGNGGTIGLSADGGTLSFGSFTQVLAHGLSGSSTAAASLLSARGGVINLQTSTLENSVLRFTALSLAANGDVTSQSNGAENDLRGDASGGSVAIDFAGGQITGSFLSINADGRAIGGGTGTGGSVAYRQSGGTVDLANLFATADGQGGTSLPGGQGGTASGGQVSVSFSGGIYNGSTFAVRAAGMGGQGIGSFAGGEGDIFLPGDGGDATGGTIEVDVDGNATLTIDSMEFRSNGEGGSGGNFGTSFGSGFFTPGRGGEGNGGQVSIDLVSGTVDAAITAASNGEGGFGGRLFIGGEGGDPDFLGSTNDPAPDGGNAFGGTATIRLAGVTGTSRYTIDTSAIGGQGGNALAGGGGGSATGGTSTLIVEGMNVSAPTVSLISGGFGGNGSNGLHGTGGTGGRGQGGEVAVQVVDSAGAVTIDGAAFSNDGRGGRGGNGRVNNDMAPVERGFDGGNGGDGVGGSITLTARDGELLLADSNGEGFGVAIGASGFGGQGGNGADNDGGNPLVPTFGGNAGFGGVGLGGRIALTAQGGTIRTDNGVPLFLSAVGEGAGCCTSGGVGNITSVTDPVTGAVTFFGGNGFATGGGFSIGGTVTLAALDSANGAGLIDLDSVNIRVSGEVSGRVELLDDGAGAGLMLGDLSIGITGFSSGGDDLSLSGSGIYVRSRDGAITVGSGLSLDIGGSFRIDAFGTGGLDVDGSLDIVASGTVLARHDGREGDGRTIAADRIAINATLINLQTGSNVVATDFGLTLGASDAILFDRIQSAGSDVILDSAGRIVGNTAIAAGQLRADSGGDTTIGRLVAGSNAIVDAGGAIRVSSLNTGQGFARLTGNGVVVDGGDIATMFTVRSGGNVAIGSRSSSAGPAIGVSSGGLSDIEAIGDIAIVALATTGAGVNSSAPAAAILLKAGGVVSTGRLISADDITILAAAMLLATGPNAPASDLTANGGIFIDTVGNATFGSASGRTIAVLAGGTVAFGSTSSDEGTDLLAGGSITGQSTTTTDGDATLRGGGTVTLANASVGDVLSLTSTGGDIVLGTSSSGYDTRLVAAGNVRIASATTTDIGITAPTSTANIIVTAGGDVALGALDSAENIDIVAASISGAASSIAAALQVTLSTTGNTSFGTLDAGGLTATAGGAISLADSSTTGLTSLTAGTGITGTSLQSTGNSVSVQSASGNVAIDRLAAAFRASVSASGGNVALGSVAAGSGGIGVSASGSVGIDAAVSGALLGISSGGDSVIGTTTSVGDSSVDAGGTIRVTRMTTTGQNGNQSSASANGAIRLLANGDIVLGALDAVGAVRIDARNLTGPLTTSSIRAGEAIAITAAQAVQIGTANGASLTIDAGGNALFGNLQAANGIALTAGGSATGQSAVTTSAGATMALSAANGLNLASINASGTATLTASAGAITVANLRSAGLVTAGGRSIAITGNGLLDFATLNATQGDARVIMASGNLVVRDGRATGELALTADAGTIESRGLQAGSIALSSTQTVTMNGISTATGAIGVTSRGLTSINGVTSGVQVRITSGDIAIGANGRIGTAGTTTSVLLINGDSAARTFVGGDDTTSGYSLSAAEMLRLFGNDITIRAPRASLRSDSVAAIDTALVGSARAPDVVIGAFTLNGGAAAGGNLGTAGTLRIETPGSARVTGAAVLNGVASGNGFAILADESIEVILGSGSIRLNGSTGLAGTLTLDSQDIVVATAAAIGDIATATDIAAIDNRLALNDGVISEDGALSAGAIAIVADNGVYIQNSGASDSLAARRGFTTGPGGLAITIGRGSATGTTPSGRIVVNGRIASDTGGFLTGLDTFDKVTVNGVTLGRTNTGVAGIAAGSTINGCEIFNTALCSVIPSGPTIQDNPLVDRDDSESEASDETVLLPGLITLRDLAPLPGEPLVDDPVTGSGNDDLWSADEDCPADPGSTECAVP